MVPTKPVGDFAMYLESAVHLLEHGALDPEFVYMPGYVAMAAAGVCALGGGVLAVKLVGAVLARADGGGGVRDHRGAVGTGGRRWWPGWPTRCGRRASPSPASPAPTCRRRC